MIGAQAGSSQRMKRVKKYFPLFLMMVPGFIYLLINNYLPMFGLVIAFKDIDFTKGILASGWAGLKNFKYLFSTADAFIITRNTILYNITFITLDLIVAVFLAILLHEIMESYSSKVYQTVLLLPYMISTVIVGYLVYAFFNVRTGYVNTKLGPLFGFPKINWYMESQYWPFILPIVNLWKTIGFSVMIYFSAIIGLDRSCYEAAVIDGATKWQQIRHITLPLLKPVMILLLLLQTGRIFYSDFGMFYQVPMDSGMLYSTTNVIDTYVYRALLRLGDVGMASAAGFYQSIVGFLLVVTTNLIIRKISPEDALF
jgi:putative aldouronate transport system permease protein